MKEKKSFWGLMVAQFLAAFNDNVFQMAVALLAIQWIQDPNQQKFMVSVSGFVFAAPFLLFSFLGGRLADRYSKPRIMQCTKVADLFVVTLAIWGISAENMTIVMIALFFLGAQSAFFGPSKYGILPELCHPEKLSQANALLNTATFVAILAGTVVGTTYIHNLAFIRVLVFTVAIGSLIATFVMDPLPAVNPSQIVRFNPLADLFENLKILRADRITLLCVIAVSYFWFMGGVYHLNMLVYVNQVMHLSERYSGYLLNAMMIGIAIGSLAAGKLSRGRVELGLVPLGAAGTTIFTLDLYFSHASFTRTLIDVFLLGVSAGLYTIPLNTMIQLRAPDKERGRILSTVNFLSFVAIALSSGFLALLGSVFKASPASIFLWLAVLSLGAMIIIFYKLPQALIRLVLYFLTNTIYRLRVVGAENVPNHGPALLVPNHVSMIDPFFISASISRLVRYIMFRDFYDKPLIHPFVKIMDAIPISENDNPKEIMRSLLVARKKLEEGHVVCIFAEGQISRLGGVTLGFKRGLDIILKGLDNVPVIPVHLEGVWGSIFSFEGKKFIWKWPEAIPYPVTVNYGKPLYRVSPSEIRQSVMDLGSEAFAIHREKHPNLFESFLVQAKRRPNQKVVTDTSGNDLTYLKLLVASTLFAKSLPDYKDNKKQNVGILLPPCAGGVIANLAVLSRGYIPVNLNYTLSKENIEDILRQSDIQHIVTSEKMLEKLGWERKPNYIYVDRVLAEKSLAEKITTGILLKVTPRSVLLRTTFRKSNAHLNDIATIMFTSGSTGIPKGVCLSHGNILSNVQSLQMILQTTPQDTILGVLPFFHSFGFTASLWFPLLAGFKAAYHVNPLDSKTIGEICRKEKVTFLMGTPTFLSAYIRRIDKECFESLRFAISGAEKLRPELAQAFEEKYGKPILEGYGCTELSPVVAFNVPNIVDGEVFQVGRKVGKIGRPIPGVSARIVNPDTFEPLQPGEAGLLIIKGPNVMKGYFKSPEKTAEVMRDGWYITGDIATIDEDGFIEITDRLSRFSKIGGEMVPHIKVEQKLHELANAVDRVFVVSSIPDEKKGEALAVLTAGFTGNLDQLWKDLNASDLPKLWIPSRDNFILVDAIPLLGTGKVDMPAVKALIAQKRST